MTKLYIVEKTKIFKKNHLEQNVYLGSELLSKDDFTAF